jgi:hypothetical protein
MAEEEKNNPPLWFMITGIIVVSIIAYFVMMAPSKPFNAGNQYYLKDAQSKIINTYAFVSSDLS